MVESAIPELGSQHYCLELYLIDDSFFVRACVVVSDMC